MNKIKFKKYKTLKNIRKKYNKKNSIKNGGMFGCFGKKKTKAQEIDERKQYDALERKFAELEAMKKLKKNVEKTANKISNMIDKIVSKSIGGTKLDNYIKSIEEYITELSEEEAPDTLINPLIEELKTKLKNVKKQKINIKIRLNYDFGYIKIDPPNNHSQKPPKWHGDKIEDSNIEYISVSVPVYSNIKQEIKEILEYLWNNNFYEVVFNQKSYNVHYPYSIDIYFADVQINDNDTFFQLSIENEAILIVDCKITNYSKKLIENIEKREIQEEMNRIHHRTLLRQTDNILESRWN